MNLENPQQNKLEQEPSPSKQEVLDILKEHGPLGKKDFEITREILDDEGNLLILDLTTLEADGGKTEYTYYRKGAPTGPGRVNGETYVCFSSYDSADSYIPTGGETIAVHNNGMWKKQ